MEKSFWLQKWERNETAFHELEANPILVKYYPSLSLAEGNKVFVPLCGKTVDIAWLLSRGCRVVGAELSEKAIEQLFAGLGVKPKVGLASSGIHHFNTENIDIFVGNVFHVSRKMLGHVDAVYDRAALVALPERMRRPYSLHIMNITQQAPQLLITYEYDQNLMPGPPFSISHEEVTSHYKDHYEITPLARIAISDGLKGCPAFEHVWLLKKKA